VKTKIDVEKLLQWALRDELPKGQAISASPWDMITRFCALGVRVDVSGHGDGLGFLGGEPHPDAIIVADAIRALDTASSVGETVDDALALFGDFAGIAHEAARAILRTTFDQRSIVMSCAAMGTRPKWQFELPTPKQMFAPSIGGAPRAIVYGIDADGDLVEVRPGADGRYRLKARPRSPLNWCLPSPLHIGECRAEWIAWHHALNSLADSLDGALAAFDVYPVALPLRPWDEPIIESRIIKGRDLSQGDVDPALAPRRRAAGKPIESPIEAESVAAYNRASREKVRRSAAI
jgi:hypothetical protein